MKRFADKGSALDRGDRASRDAGAVQIVAASTVGSRNEAQRAPTRRQGFVDAFRECAQTSFARIAKTPCFSAESFEGNGLTVLGLHLGTLEPMPMCVLQAHVVARARRQRSRVARNPVM